MTVRASQIVAEVLVRAGPAPSRASQIVAEILVRAGSAPSRASQLLAEALVGSRSARASQIAAEILVWSRTLTTPPIFPTIASLGFSVMKRPAFYNGSETSGSGWNVRVGYASAPTWEWDLTYELLQDSASPSALKLLVGFYLAMQGDLVPFLFLDPDDNAVAGQPIGTTDGATTNWTLVRSYGGASGSGNEPVGYVNAGQAFNVYLNGTLQSPSTYTVVTTTPVAQQVKFSTAPAAGQAVTVDMGYYYYVHFKDPTNEFEKFMYQLWSLKKITLASLRG
jgi:hypothetical protein